MRNVATVGGHLAHADPHMDLPPVLIALGAHVVVAGRAGERTIPVEELFAGYFETVLARDELISTLVVPAQADRRAAYLKCTTRAVHDWPALGVAVSLDSDGKAVRDARIVISAATETPARLAGAEQALRGGDTSEAPAAAGGRGRGRGGAGDHRRAGLGGLQAAAGARLCGARAARGAGRQRRTTVMATRTIGSGQVGRSVPRLEGAGQGHRPRRIRAQSAAARHALRQDLPQHAWRMAASSAST